MWVLFEGKLVRSGIGNLGDILGNTGKWEVEMGLMLNTVMLRNRNECKTNKQHLYICRIFGNLRCDIGHRAFCKDDWM